MAAGRHLEFGRTGNSAIRSADPEHRTLELSIKWIDDPLWRYGHSKFDITRGALHLRPQLFREGEVVGVVGDCTTVKSDVGFL